MLVFLIVARAGREKNVLFREKLRYLRADEKITDLEFMKFKKSEEFVCDSPAASVLATSGVVFLFLFLYNKIVITYNS